VNKRLLQFWLCYVPVLCILPRAAGAELSAPVGEKAKHARVVMVHEPGAIVAFSPQPDKVISMVARGLTNLTGKATAREAWLSLVSTQDTVGLRVFSAPGAASGTRRVVVEAVVQGLLAAGLPPKQIVVWDKRLADLRHAGFFDLAERHGVRVAGSAEAGYDEKADPYETALLGQLVWGDLEFGRKGEGVGRKSFVSRLVSQQMTKIINIPPLLNHNLVGVSGNLWGLALSSVDNTLRFETDLDRLVEAVPEIFALPALGDHVVLNVVDALICQYQGGEKQRLHYSTVLNQLWFSTDPVALDVLAIQELNRQREEAKAPGAKTNVMELYTNASLLELGISDPRRIDIHKAAE